MADGGAIDPSDSPLEEKTVLFADIVDSTGLYDELGDKAARALLVECLDYMDATVLECKGDVHAHIGDEILCLFDDPEDAAHAASQLQQRVIEGHGKRKLSHPMRIRIGLEHGPVIHTKEGLFGTTVHTAARVAALAKAGQILTTESTLERLSALRRRMTRYFDRIVLKGIASEQEIWELLWDTSVTFVPTSRPKRRVRATGIEAVELAYGGEMWRVDASRPRIELGRDSHCTIHLEGNAVSRLHARVTWNRGQVRVEDVSTNGTCIEPEGKTSLTVHHESKPLAGQGILRCGCLGREEDAALVRYRCLAPEGEA